MIRINTTKKISVGIDKKEKYLFIQTITRYWPAFPIYYNQTGFLTFRT